MQIEPKIEYHIRAASGRTVMTFDTEETLISWFKRQPRPDTLNIIKRTINDEVVIL